MYFILRSIADDISKTVKENEKFYKIRVKNKITIVNPAIAL